MNLEDFEVISFVLLENGIRPISLMLLGMVTQPIIHSPNALLPINERFLGKWLIYNDLQ